MEGIKWLLHGIYKKNHKFHCNSTINYLEKFALKKSGFHTWQMFAVLGKPSDTINSF